MKTVPPERIASMLKDDFNIEMDLYTVVRHSATALAKMHMAELHKEVLIGLVENYCIKLPPEAVTIASVVWTSKPMDSTWKYEIQSITHPPQIVFRSDETDSNGNLTETPQVINNYIPPQHYGYIPYVWECPYVKLNETDIEVAIEYSTLTLDERGYPKLPEDATEAFVNFCVFKHMQPLFLLGKVPLGVFEEVKRWKDQAINQAKNDIGMKGLSRNGLNNLLNVLTSFDRKKFNIDA